MQTHPENYVPIIKEWLELVESKQLPPRTLWEVIHVATHKDVVGTGMVENQEVWWELLKEYDIEGTPLREIQNSAKGMPYLNCLASMEWLDKRAIFTTEPVPGSGEQDKAGPPSQYRLNLPQGSIGMSLPYVEVGDLIYIAKGGRTVSNRTFELSRHLRCLLTFVLFSHYFFVRYVTRRNSILPWTTAFPRKILTSASLLWAVRTFMA